MARREEVESPSKEVEALCSSPLSYRRNVGGPGRNQTSRSSSYEDAASSLSYRPDSTS
jgi:hypothetical protein